MTVSELAVNMGLETLSLSHPDREVTSAYAGDLLSWVMGRAEDGCVWATIMTNLNIVAVATLVDMATIVVCEGCEIPDEVISAAKEKQVNLLRSPLPIYEFCVAVSRCLQ